MQPNPPPTESDVSEPGDVSAGLFAFLDLVHHHVL